LFKRNLVTLDFDGSTIRLLAAHEKQVTHWESLRLPAEQMSMGVIHDPLTVGAALRDLFERNQAGRGRLVTSVTGLRAIARVFTLPTVKERFLEDSVRHKIRQEIPLPLEEMDLSWHVVSRSREEQQVYALAVPREAIDSQVEALAAAGRRLHAMEIKPLALARLAEGDPALILNLEEHSLSIVVLSEGVPSIVRTVPFGGTRSTPEARLELLLQELGRTTKFFNEAHKGRPLSPETAIYATGEEFEKKEFLDLLARRHPGPVQVPACPLTHPAELPIAAYSVNVGLALKRV
jgi:Tfp pilus assembly PilM family ATPase